MSDDVLTELGAEQKLELIERLYSECMHHIANRNKLLQENLTSTQARCTELIQENRRLNKELATSDATVQALTRTIGQLEEELNELRAANVLARK